ncbi:MAG TPA: flagellar basal body rod C-terminal domain-containing protein [Methylomirabilota bacterium]|jgi:flagellar basal-body rod protein FlgC|nr:flagellar basal body rod C-terminal domain-containing protein [Methylomirabilota bacterium]
MISSLYISLSGLKALQKQLAIAAHNLANVNTDGFKKSRAVLQEAKPQGVTAQPQKLELPGPLLLEQRPDGEQLIEQSNVDVGEEIPNVLIGQRAYEANLKMLKAADETTGTLLDIIQRS